MLSRSISIFFIFAMAAAVSGCCGRTADNGRRLQAFDPESHGLKRFEIPAGKQTAAVEPARRRRVKPGRSEPPVQNQELEQDLARAKEYCRRGMEMSAVRHLDRVLEKAGERDYMLKTKAHYLLSEIYQSKQLDSQADYHWMKFMDSHEKLQAEPGMQARRDSLKATADFIGPAAGLEETVEDKQKPAKTGDNR